MCWRIRASYLIHAKEPPPRTYWLTTRQYTDVMCHSALGRMPDSGLAGTAPRLPHPGRTPAKDQGGSASAKPPSSAVSRASLHTAAKRPPSKTAAGARAAPACGMEWPTGEESIGGGSHASRGLRALTARSTMFMRRRAASRPMPAAGSRSAFEEEDPDWNATDDVTGKASGRQRSRSSSFEGSGVSPRSPSVRRQARPLTEFCVFIGGTLLL